MVFPADHLEKHASSCSLGDSYSFWIPWDQVGGPTRHLSLVTRFEGRNGGVVISNPANKLLPGKASQVSDTKVSTSQFASVAPAGFVQQVNGHSDIDAESSTETAREPPPLTITLPPSDVRRLAKRQVAQTTFVGPNQQGVTGSSAAPGSLRLVVPTSSSEIQATEVQPTQPTGIGPATPQVPASPTSSLDRDTSQWLQRRLASPLSLQRRRLSESRSPGGQATTDDNAAIVPLGTTPVAAAQIQR